jgi:hypothetical protein
LAVGQRTKHKFGGQGSLSADFGSSIVDIISFGAGCGLGLSGDS